MECEGGEWSVRAGNGVSGFAGVLSQRKCVSHYRIRCMQFSHLGCTYVFI